MLKYLAFLTKKQGMDTPAFIDYYENVHVPLIRRLAPTPVVYKRRYLMRDDELTSRSGLDFDVVTELVFENRQAYAHWRAQLYGPGAAGLVLADEERFLDRLRTCACVIEEHVTSG
jgi:hypothetical protein